MSIAMKLSNGSHGCNRSPGLHRRARHDLTADSSLYNGQVQLRHPRRTFRRRGMGLNASRGSAQQRERPDRRFPLYFFEEK